MASLDQTENFVRVTTAESVSSTQTSITLTDASTLPDPANGEYNLVIWDSDNYSRPDEDPGVEIIRATSIDYSTDTITVSRGQEGTSGSSHPNGASVHLAPTAKMFSDIESEIFSGSHTDLTDITSDAHHTKYTDTDAVDAVGASTPFSNSDLSNSSVSVAGNSVSLGGSTGVNHSDLSSISSDDHHTKYTDENAQDAVGTILNNDFTYDDAGNSISLSSNSVTVAGNTVSLGGSTGISHGDLSSIGASDHHTRFTDNTNDRLSDIPTRPHSDLTNVNSDDHHSKYTDSDARSALEGSSPSFSSVTLDTLYYDKNVSGSGMRVEDRTSPNALHKYYDDGSGANAWNEQWYDGNDYVLLSATNGGIELEGDQIATEGQLFGGSHTDLSDVNSDNHHAKYTDSEAVSAVTSEDPLSLNNGLSVGGGSSISLNGTNDWSIRNDTTNNRFRIVDNDNSTAHFEITQGGPITLKNADVDISSGQLGIGQNKTDFKLEVYNANSDVSGLYVEDPTGGAGDYGAFFGFDETFSTGNNLVLGTRDNGTDQAGLLIDRASTDVSIPSGDLSVSNGNIDIDNDGARIRINDNGSGSPYPAIEFEDGGADLWQITNNGNDNSIEFRADGDSSKVRLSVGDSGNVSIPSGNLDLSYNFLDGVNRLLFHTADGRQFLEDRDSSKVDYYDSNFDVVASFKDGGNVSIPNGRLKIEGFGGNVGLTIQGDATGSSNTSYLEFTRSDGTRSGLIGDNSSNDNDIYLSSVDGSVNVFTQGDQTLKATANQDVSIPNGSLSVSDAQGSDFVAESGDTMTGDLNFSGSNAINWEDTSGNGEQAQISTDNSDRVYIKSGGGIIRLRSSDDTDSFKTNENNNAEVPNGDFTVSGNITLSGNWIYGNTAQINLTGNTNRFRLTSSDSYVIESDTGSAIAQFYNTGNVEILNGSLTHQDFTWSQDGDDYVLSDGNVDLIRQPKGGATEFIQGADIGSIEAPEDSLTQIINASVTGSAASGDSVGYTFSVDNQTGFQVTGTADGSGGLSDLYTSLSGNRLEGLTKLDGANGNHRIRFDSDPDWIEITDQSNTRSELVTDDVFFDQSSTWFSDHASNNSAHHSKYTDSEAVSAVDGSSIELSELTITSNLQFEGPHPNFRHSNNVLKLESSEISPVEVITFDNDSYDVSVPNGDVSVFTGTVTARKFSTDRYYSEEYNGADISDRLSNAIADSSTGQIVNAEVGLYNSNLSFSKRISLRGSGAGQPWQEEGTFVNGDDTWTISGTASTVHGLGIEGSLQIDAGHVSVFECILVSVGEIRVNDGVNNVTITQIRGGGDIIFESNTNNGSVGTRSGNVTVTDNGNNQILN